MRRQLSRVAVNNSLALLHLPKNGTELVETFVSNASASTSTLNISMGKHTLSKLRLNEVSDLQRGDVIQQDDATVAVVVEKTASIMTAFREDIQILQSNSPFPAGIRFAVGDIVTIAQTAYVVVHTTSTAFELSPHATPGVYSDWHLQRRTDLDNVDYRRGPGELFNNGTLWQCSEPHELIQGDIVVIDVGGQPEITTVTSAPNPTDMVFEHEFSINSVTSWWRCISTSEATVVKVNHIELTKPMSISVRNFYNELSRSEPISLGLPLHVTEPCCGEVIQLAVRGNARSVRILPTLPLGPSAIVAVWQENGETGLCCYGHVDSVGDGGVTIVH